MPDLVEVKDKGGKFCGEMGVVGSGRSGGCRLGSDGGTRGTGGSPAATDGGLYSERKDGQGRSKRYASKLVCYALKLVSERL